MNIEIERFPNLQSGTPGAVIIKLIGSDKELKGSVCIYPRWHAPGEAERFQVEVNKGSGSFPDIDIKLQI